MKTLIYSNLFIALCAGVLTLGTYGLINTIPDLILGIHVFGVTLMAYNVQRLVRLEKFSNRTDQIRWYLKNKWILYTTLIIGVLLAAVTLFYLPIRILLYFSPLALISVFYSIPFGQGISIRSIPGVKILLISLVWTGVTMALPMVMSGVILGSEEVLLMVQRFLFILAITIPFDIRDLKYDEEAMNTIPQQLGVQKSKRVAMGLIFICLVIEAYLPSSLSDPGFQKLILCVFYLTVMMLISRVKEDSSDGYFTGVLDGTMLLLGLILIFV